MVDEVDVWFDDFMSRKPSSDFLTSYILANDHIKVLNVNSPWGSGKTFFLERWRQELSKEHVCVIFNAWETDYAADPLLALVTCIEQQTKDKLNVTSTEAGQRAVNLGASILKKAAPLIAKGLVRKYVGVELDELLGDEGAKETTGAAGDLVSSLIVDQSNTSRQVKEFKASVIETLSKAAENNGLKKPAFIFIDELDRCRPTYAIELLERIKHFFELDGCRFVIASDSSQLAHSIRAVYGQGFSSEKYLNRFFDSEFSLDNSNIFNLVNRLLPEINSIFLDVNVTGVVNRALFFDSSHLRFPQKNTVVCDISGFTENQLLFVSLCKYFKVELRELSNYMKQIKSAADSLGGSIHFFWLAYLVFFKASKAEQYADLWFSDKWRAAVASYNSEFAENVNISFSSELTDISEFANFYLTIIHSSKDEFNNMSRDLKMWRRDVYSGARGQELNRLRQYRSIVELAHRLT